MLYLNVDQFPTKMVNPKNHIYLESILLIFVANVLLNLQEYILQQIFHLHLNF